MARILLVENDKVQRRATATLLREAGHEIADAEDGGEAMDFLRNQSFDIVLLEMILPTVDGTAVLNFIETLPTPPKVIATAFGTEQMPAEIALLIAKPQTAATLKKPFNDADLIAKIDGILNAV